MHACFVAVFFYVARKEKILRERGTACPSPAAGFRFGAFRPVTFALFAVVVLALSLSYGGRHTRVPRPPYNLYDGRRTVRSTVAAPSPLCHKRGGMLLQASCHDSVRA